MLTPEKAKAQLKELQSTIEYAYAMGHGCSIGDHPRFRAIRKREQNLLAIINEHKELVTNEL